MPYLSSHQGSSVRRQPHIMCRSGRHQGGDQLHPVRSQTVGTSPPERRTANGQAHIKGGSSCCSRPTARGAPSKSACPSARVDTPSVPKLVIYYSRRACTMRLTDEGLFNVSSGTVISMAIHPSQRSAGSNCSDSHDRYPQLKRKKRHAFAAETMGSEKLHEI